MNGLGSGPPVLVLHHDIGAPERPAFYEALARDFTDFATSDPGYDGVPRPDWMQNVRDLAVFYQGLLAWTAATRLYSSPTDEKPMTPAEEKAQVEKVWKETYKGLENVPIAIGTDTMVGYGVPGTRRFALVDRRGVVRLYAPTRLSEAELSRRIEEVLAEAP